MASSGRNGNGFDAETLREENKRSPEAELAALVARDLRRYVTRQVGSLGGLAGTWTESIGQSSKGAAQKGAQEVGAAYGRARHYMRENPIKSVAGGFAVGALLGILTK